jgi:hypothetical protein
MAKKQFYGLAKNDKILYLSGVPLNCLKSPITVKDLNFTITSLANRKQTVNITAARQQEVLYELIRSIDSIGDTGLFGVGSYPTEQAAYDLSTLITRTFFNKVFKEGRVPEVKWIDLGRPDWEFLHSNESCDLCVIHGLSNTSDDTRLNRAKDFIHRTEFCTTILLANTENILKYIVGKVNVSPDIVWQLSKTTHEVFL